MLLEVQLPLESAHHVVVDRTLRAETQERLALRVDDGAPDLAVLDDLLIFFPGARGIVTILEGESLLNDATSLTIYSIAVAAAVGGSFKPSTGIMRRPQ
jgi:hypothetical protein